MLIKHWIGPEDTFTLSHLHTKKKENHSNAKITDFKGFCLVFALTFTIYAGKKYDGHVSGKLQACKCETCTCLVVDGGGGGGANLTQLLQISN